MKLTSDNVEQLKKLKREINQTYHESVSAAQTARSACNAAVVAAITCGTAMNDAKSIVGHRKWQDWAAENCPQVSERTYQRYMVLAKASHVTDLTHCETLRQAYIVVGILPAPEPQGDKPARDPFVVVLSHVSRLKSIDVQGWQPDQRAKLRTELAPVVRALWPESVVEV